MIKISWVLSVIFLFSPLMHCAQDVKIRLFASFNIHALTINPSDYHFELFPDGAEPIKLKRNHAYQIIVQENNLKVKDRFGVLGTYNHISIMPAARNNDLKIDAPQSGLPARFYEGVIDIEVKNNNLFVINTLDIENYVAGVVEAESGVKAEIEYYKAQAVICRTYLLSHLDRHKPDGFNLCDDVHCQVYKGKPRLSTDIIEATLSTSGMVIIDSSKTLITAAFHSNCGGQTANSEDVWSKSLPYLRSVTDTFCLTGRNATWIDSLPSEKWQQYLNTLGVSADSSLRANESVHFDQHHRVSYWVAGADSFLLKTIRNDLKFRSAFFSFSPSGSYIVFKGRGYGHGVGLCQEGAMKMAEAGLSYLDIIKFYYTGVTVLHINQLPQTSP